MTNPLGEQQGASPGETGSEAAPRPAGKGLLIGLALTLLSVALMIVVQPAFGGFWPLLFVAVVPAIVAQYRFMPRKLSGLPLGVAWFGYWMAWLVLSLQIMPPAVVIVISVVFALAGVVISSFDRILSERTEYRWFLLQLPVTWTAFNVLYQDNLLLGPEGQYGGWLTAVPLLAQPISLLGSAALTFFLVLVNCAVALIVIGWMDRRREPSDSVPVSAGVIRTVGLTGLAVVIVWVLVASGQFVLARSEQGRSVRVAAIQPGPGDGYTAAGFGGDTPALHAKLARMTREAAARGAKFAVWGEVVLHFDPRTDPKQLVQNLARETGMYIQTGWSVGQPSPKATNVVGLWNPKGHLVGIYYKIHPVVADNEEFVQPVRYPTYDTDIGTIGMIVCFDAAFEDPTRIMVANGAQLMSASVGDWTHIGATRINTFQLRAVEDRVPYIKSELFNGSALIDSTGTVVDRASLGPNGGEAVLVGDLPLGAGSGGTFYTATGPAFGYLCVVALAVRIVLQVRVRRARRAESATSERKPA